MAAGKINLQKASGGITAITGVDGASNTQLVLPESGTVSSVDTSVTDNAIARYDGTTGKLQNSGVIIDDSGNVGIGTSSPVVNLGKALHIYNNINDSTSNSNASLKLESANRNSAILLYGAVNTISMFTSSGVSTGGIAMDSNFGTTVLFGSNGFGYGTGSGGTVTQLTSKSTSVTLNKPTGTVTTAADALAAGASVSFTVFNSLFTANDVVIAMGRNLPYDSNNYRIEGFNAGAGGFGIRITNVSTVSRSEALVVNFTIIKGANT